MHKIKLTRPELKHQKHKLNKLSRFLPILKLRQSQLLEGQNSLEKELQEIEKAILTQRKEVKPWSGVFADSSVDLQRLLSIQEVIVKKGNIAGVEVDLFERVNFHETAPDLLHTPIWIDSGLNVYRELMTLTARKSIVTRELIVISEEFLKTMQRVNLYEKRQIPDALKSIHTIKVFLGDEERAAVIRAKIAKEKLESKRRKLSCK